MRLRLLIHKNRGANFISGNRLEKINSFVIRAYLAAHKISRGRGQNHAAEYNRHRAKLESPKRGRGEFGKSINEATQLHADRETDGDKRR